MEEDHSDYTQVVRAINKYATCRTCLQDIDEDSNNYLISDEEIGKMLSTCTDIHVNEEYPEGICLKCYEELLVAYNFKMRAEWCEQQLKDRIFFQVDEHEEEVEEYEEEEIQSGEIVDSDDAEVDEGLEEIFVIQEAGDTEELAIMEQDGESSSQASDTKVVIPQKTKILVKTQLKKPKRQTFSQDMDADKKYKCNFCEKRFRTANLRSCHHLRHAKEPTYGCKTCGKKFMFQSLLRTHEKCHSDVRPFACDQCPWRFINAYGLRVHKRSHTGERPFICSLCGKSYGTKHDLKVHIRGHTNEKPYVCEVESCGKAYKSSSQLTSHMRSHNEQRLFECILCQETFRKKRFLTEHLATHSETKPYSCDMCQFRAEHEDLLKLHMKRHGLKEGEYEGL